MNHLTPEQRQTGRENFYNSLGVTRRDLLKAAIVAPAAGAFYFGYSRLEGNPVRAGLIGTGDEGGILLTQSNPDYVQFVAYSDIRPSQIERAKYGDTDGLHRVGFMRKYELNEEQFDKEIRFYEDYHLLLEDPDIEMVVIALPLHLHHPAVIDALEAGKHVLCEKLMAKEVGQCKEMARKAKEKDLYLAVGHQRHYSVLYDNALSIFDSDLLGDIQHIRALWHRNNTWPQMKYNKEVEEDGLIQLHDSWRKPIPTLDLKTNFQKYNYDSLEELCRWQLYNRTSGGLMAELGSDQLDACSLFLGQVHPFAVSGVGGKYFYKDEREVEDHVFMTLEFPGYDHPQGKKSGTNENDIVVVTYSSTNTNSLEHYGEQIQGSRGTLLVEREQDVLLFKEPAPGEKASMWPTEVTISRNDSGQPALETAESPGSAPAAAGLAQATLAEKTSRGYREEMEHLAWCIRNPAPENQPRCGPTVALADAVYALTANLAMRRQQRIEFKPEWFDIDSDEVPEEVASNERRAARKKE